MNVKSLSKHVAPVVLTAALALGALTPGAARAQDDLTRVLVDVADVVLRSGTPYYRYGNGGYNDRLIVARDRYGRPIYYRQLPRQVAYRQPTRVVYVPRPVYRPVYRTTPNRYYTENQGRYDRKCNKHGKCKVTYYDPRRDQHDERRDHDDRYREVSYYVR